MASAGEDRGRADHTEGPTRVTFSSFISANKIPCLLFGLRIFAVLNGVLFFLPLFSTPVSSYKRTIVSYAAVSAFRLSERLAGQPISRAWFSLATSEDSGHYLFFCLVFFFQPPIGVVLMPLVLFSVLHAVMFSKKIFQNTHIQPSPIMQKLISLVDTRQREILQTVGNVEVILMPLTIALVFMGGAKLFLPFVYYRFVTMRYKSQRNPYCRLAFMNFRLLGEHLARHPSCPGFASNAIYRIIGFVSRLQPA